MDTEFSPSEVREAAVYACVLFEERRTRTMIIPKSSYTDVLEMEKNIQKKSDSDKFPV